MIVENENIDQIENIWKNNNKGYICYECNQRSIKDEQLLKVIFKENDTVYGYAVLYFGKDFCEVEEYPNNIVNMPDKVAYIWEIVTDINYLRKGIATSILEYIKDKYKGYSIYSCINLSNEASLKLHSKIGFKTLYEFELENNSRYTMMELKEDKYKILILSNPNNYEYIEDTYIANAFKEDGHLVDLLWIDYDEKLDTQYDVIIRRNTWVEDEKDTYNYKIKNQILKERLIKKKLKTVNLEGLDGRGKQYLCELFNNGKKVIPTIDNLKDIDKLPYSEEYVLKDNDSFGSGLGQRMVKANELKTEFQTGDLIQPRMKFKSEVQCYFVGDKLMYVYEYTPSKYPNYPTPKLITLNQKEKVLAYEFARISNLKVGFQRIDFLKLENDELILLEIEDNSPHMNLELLNTTFRNSVLDEYKKNIYQYIKGK